MALGKRILLLLQVICSTTQASYYGSSSGRCASASSAGTPVTNGRQTTPNFLPNNDGTRYNYNEVLHKSILFYEAQRSGALPPENRIPWRGDSALKDGCDIAKDVTGGWYDAGDSVKFNFPMAYSLTVLAWGGEKFGDAYKAAGEWENMINAVKWSTEYFIRAHISKYELVAQVGHGKTDHDNWGRPEELSMDRPTYTITASQPGTELAAEVAAALAASSIFLNESLPTLSADALKHAKELYEFADTYRGNYHISVPDAENYYKSYSGYNDELIWSALWLYKATKEETYLKSAIDFYNATQEEFSEEDRFSWDTKFLGAQGILAEITGESKYREPFLKYLNGLENDPTTPKGLYYLTEWGPNRYTGTAALLALIGAGLQPPPPRKDSYVKWAEKQIGLLLGDTGRSYVIGFGNNFPRSSHHRASSCPPYPQKCDWSTYHSSKSNHYILYGALVGGPDQRGSFKDNRQEHKGNQVACDYNAGFQSAVAGLKYFKLRTRISTESTSTEQESATATTTAPTTTQSWLERIRCARAKSGSPVSRAGQTTPNFKPNTDGTKYNYNEVLHKSILFYEAQRSGPLPQNNRIPWRGDSGMKDGCDLKVDVTGGWYDAGDHVKFNFPMAFTLTTLAWGGIAFRHAYEDAGELNNFLETIKWTTRYLIKSHTAKYEFVGQVGDGNSDHDNWGRPEEMSMARPAYKITTSNPGTELAAEAAAALAASSIVLSKSAPDLSKQALKHAEELFEFGNEYRGSYDKSIPDIELYYRSYSGYEDELVWAATWLYKATKKDAYLKTALEIYNKTKHQFDEEDRFSWDTKFLGTQALLSEITKDETFRSPFATYLDTLQAATTTPEGLYHISEWAPNKYTGGAALLAVVGALMEPPLPRKDTYLLWAKKQIGLLLGDTGMSYVIGFGNSYPTLVHHRSSSCPPYPDKCDWSTYHSPGGNHYILYGGLVGGPKRDGSYSNDRESYESSQVGCDHNAGFQSAVAGLKHIAMMERKGLIKPLATAQGPKTTQKSPDAQAIAEKVRCARNSRSGIPVDNPKQTQPTFKPNNDGTKYNYNEVLHKSMLFYEAQKSGKLLPSNRIPWRGDSGLKDGCDIGVDMTGGWYDAGDHVKFHFPMAFTLTTLAWGGIEFRDAYKDSGEYHHMINTVKWPTEYLIKAHISKYELVGQVGKGKTDHESWGRAEDMDMMRPAYKITKNNPGTELAAEVAAALAASSIFLKESYPTLAAEALQHAEELYEFADSYRGTYHESITDAAMYYKSYSGYEDELIWAAVWLYKATKNETFLSNAVDMHNKTKEKFANESVYSWDTKFIGSQVLLANLTGEAIYREAFTRYLDSLQLATTTPQGLYFHSEWAPNRYTGGAALMAVMGATLRPPLARKDSYLEWATNQTNLILGDSGISYMIGFGESYPRMVHHRSSSCPPHPETCGWSSYHSYEDNYFILYGGIVGGPDEEGFYHDSREAYDGSQVACDYNAGFQSAIAGLKHFVMKKRGETAHLSQHDGVEVVSLPTFLFKIFSSKDSPATTTARPITTTRPIEKSRCDRSSRSGNPVFNARQTPIDIKKNTDGTKHNYNDVIYKSILFFEAQRSGPLPSDNRIPWRGDSGLKDGCDIRKDLTGGWYDAGDFVKFHFPMAFSLTTLAWGGIAFRDAYKDAGEYNNMVNTVKWGTDYLIKSHVSKYAFIAQVGNGKADHEYWGRPETMSMHRPAYKITSTRPGSDLAAEAAAALAASSIFLNDTLPELAKQALQHAKDLYEFADKYRGLYHESIPDAEQFYKSHSGYDDELIWGAAWLYKATKDKNFLQKATAYYVRMKGRYLVEPEYSWDKKLVGAQALLAQMTGATIYRDPLEKFLDRLLSDKTTPQGLYFYREWGPNRYTAGASLMAIMGSVLQPPLAKREAYKKWAETQIGLLLGDAGMSYVIGYGTRYPSRPHHRSSTCPPYPQQCDWSTYKWSQKNYYTLYGALVGGPSENGAFQDRRNVFGESEVSCDYNACFQSAVAGVKYLAMKTRKNPQTTTPSTTGATTVETNTPEPTTTATQKTLTTKPKRRRTAVKRFRCRPKNSPRCQRALRRRQNGR